MIEQLAVLVVEDDISVRRALTRSLTYQGGKVRAVATFAAARMANRAQLFHVALLDVQLPDGTGLDLIEPLRRRNSDVVVLVMTGLTDHGVIKRVNELGARYLLKPVDPDQLVLLLDEARSRQDAGERRLKATLRRWVEDHDLTDGEAALLDLGARGVPRDNFVGHRKVQIETIKKQIRILLGKTGHETFEAAVSSLLREALNEP